MLILSIVSNRLCLVYRPPLLSLPAQRN